LTKDAPLLLDHLCEECSSHFDSLKANLEGLGVRFITDGRIVRGLDYYTKTAFEVISTDLGSQDALAGGGRYDLLSEQLGGKATPAVGFAAGMERLLMVMEKHDLPFGENKPLSLFIVALDPASRMWALQKAHELRHVHVACDIDYLGRSIKSQMREADRQQTQHVLVVGPDELASGTGKLKRMSDGTETEILLSRLTTYFA